MEGIKGMGVSKEIYVYKIFHFLQDFKSTLVFILIREITESVQNFPLEFGQSTQN